MCKINLQTTGKSAVTIVSNVFIDRYMKDAKGTYVKVYLYLLRCLADSSVELSLSAIADRLEETEGDVKRALKYWEKVHVLSYAENSEGEICDIALVDLEKTPGEREAAKDTREKVIQSAPKQKPSYCAAQLEQFKSFDDFNNVLDYIEELVGRPLSSKELQTPAYLYECLGFQGELIGFVFDYCFKKNKKSFAYIEKVAYDWYEHGIRTVTDAQESDAYLAAELAAVRKAFGISREFGAVERKYILHWCNDLKMSDTLITEACNRTIMQVSKPDFKYADKILKNWSDKGFVSLEQVKAADEEHKKTSGTRNRKSATPSDVIIPNKFNNYVQRTYTKEDDLEMRLLNK